MIWAGAILTLLGLMGIVYSIIKVSKAKRAALPDEEMRKALAKLLPVNLASLFVSTLGLMIVIVGIALS